MNQFYVSIMFLGIILVLFSIAMVAFDKKRAGDYITRVDAKKQELAEIIADAELMIEEMNKFSDYIVTQMDLKNDQLTKTLKDFENEVSIVSSRSVGYFCEKPVKNEKVANSGYLYYNDHEIAARNTFTGKSGFYDEEEAQTAKQTEKLKTGKVAEKVIPMNSKFREVIQLSHNGMDNNDIAKLMNMGKGEVNLIIETCRLA